MNTRLFTQTRTVTLAALLCGGCLLVARGAVLRELRAFISGKPVVTALAPPTHAAAPHAPYVVGPLAAPAQSRSNYALPQTVLAGGGGESSGGSFATQGTIGQSLTGVSNGGAFTLESGFWPNGATPPPTTANAGPDQKIPTSTPSVTLAANTPSNGTGAWSIVSAPSVLLTQFSNTTNPTAMFTPAGGTGYYILRWTISNAPSTASTDNVLITVADAPTIAKAFSPATIVTGGTAIVTLTLTNPNSIAPVAAFTDTLTNMTAVGGAIGGTCGLVAPLTIPANATNLSFSGIALPSSGSCMVTFAVRSLVNGIHPNTTSGVTTDLTTAAGAPSNTAHLTVAAPTQPTVTKAFSPATITVGGTSTVMLTLSSTYSVGLLASFTDNLTNMAAVGGPIGTTCATLSPITLSRLRLAANATNLSFNGLVIPAQGSCTVSFAVTSNVGGVHPNTTSGVTTDQSSAAGPPSNTANLTVTAAPQKTLASKAVRNDFDGDGQSDRAQWRSELGEWQVKFSSDGEQHQIPLVEPNDKDEYVAVAADFDGDLKADAAVWRPRDGRWLIKRSLSGELVKAQFGLPGDVPMPADYDGDGRADLAVWRNGDGWHIQRSSNLTEQAIYLGQSGDVPVIGDFDGDGKTDIAVFRASEGRWLWRNAATGQLSDAQFGQAGDTPLTADFDGDGKDDLTVWSATKAALTYQRSSDQQEQKLTINGQVLLGDYDGDGKSDCAIGNGTGWLMRLSSRAWE